MSQNVHTFPERKLEMSQEEMGAIAIAFTRHHLAKHMHLEARLLEEIDEIASELGVKPDRLMLVVEILTRENLENMFVAKK